MNCAAASMPSPSRSHRRSAADPIWGGPAPITSLRRRRGVDYVVTRPADFIGRRHNLTKLRRNPGPVMASCHAASKVSPPWLSRSCRAGSFSGGRNENVAAAGFARALTPIPSFPPSRRGGMDGPSGPSLRRRFVPAKERGPVVCSSSSWTPTWRQPRVHARAAGVTPELGLRDRSEYRA